MFKRNPSEVSASKVSAKKRKTDPLSDVSNEKKFLTKSSNFQTLCSVLVAGQGDLGQLGLGKDQGLPEKSPLRSFSRREFTEVPGMKDIVAACAGGLHTVCLNSQGEVLTCGCNDEGALGRPQEDGVEDSGARFGKVLLQGKVVQITAGDCHTAALLEDGRVYAWGSLKDSYGSMWRKSELPRLIPIENVKMVASGWNHLLMLTTQGEVFSCGSPEQGQLARVSEERATRQNGNSLRSSESPKYPDGIKALLQPIQVLRKFQEDIMSIPSQALKIYYKVPPSTSFSLQQPCCNPFLSTSSFLRVDKIWAGACGSFIQSDDGSIHISGLNNNKQLGHEDTRCVFGLTKSTTLSNRNWVKICGDQHHTLALDSNGLVYALGKKEFGRLGLGMEVLGDGGSETQVGEPTIVPNLQDKKCIDISCGNSCSFAVTDDGALYAWGMGCSGQLGLLGLREDEDVWEPTRVNDEELRKFTVLAVSAGGQHTVILAQNRSEDLHT